MAPDADPAPTPGAGAMALAGVRFASELAALVGAGVAGAAAGPVGAVAAAVAFAVVWGVAIAPKSDRRLPDPGRLAVEVALFLAVGAGLVARGHPVGGVLLGGVGIAAAVALRVVPGTPGLDP